MSGRCRYIAVPFMVSEEFVTAQNTFNLHHDLHDIARQAVKEYNDNITEMYYLLLYRRADAAAKLRAEG